MPKQTEIAILFADIVGSTKLYEKLGDNVAREKIAGAIGAMTEITGKLHGRVVKTIGDEVMCTFPKVEDAAQAAWDMQETFDEEAESNTDGSPIAVKIGLHFGPAIMEDDGDVYGDAVNIAARMVSQAKARQIITTHDTLERLPATISESSRFVDRAAIKGKADEMDIYEIIWQETDLTYMITGLASKAGASEVTLRVTYDGHTFELGKKRPDFVIGRSQNCDLTVNQKLVSRQHVRIELRKDKFFIIDQSTNGTHVVVGDNPEELLHREELPVNGSGRLSLGKEIKNNPESTVEFTLDS